MKSSSRPQLLGMGCVSGMERKRTLSQGAPRLVVREPQASVSVQEVLSAFRGTGASMERRKKEQNLVHLNEYLLIVWPLGKNAFMWVTLFYHFNSPREHILVSHHIQKKTVRLRKVN